MLCLLLAGCSGKDSSDALQERGELRFITRNGPTTYYLGRGGPRGFEYDLAAGLATQLDVELVVIQAFSLTEMLRALNRGEADIAGAGLTFTEARSKRYAHTSAYASQRPQVIYKAGELRPRELSDLRGRSIAVLANSSHESLLEELKRDGLSWLSWTAIDGVDLGELLRRVDRGSSDLALVDSRDFAIQQNLVPRLKVAFDLAQDRDIVWYLPRSARNSPLLDVINEYLQRARDNGQIATLQQRYFDRDEAISRVDSHTFVGKMQADLASYQQLIEIVAREQELPWELLAAISYQESHWDPQATSRTGVRGMMMLTRATAGELGVSDRTDPAQSLRGGARYFKDLRRRLPEDIMEPDRGWLAMAAYNIGMGHLEDARVLTELLGGDPHHWKDVMKTLPLLEDPQYYRDLRYGFARGSEAVRYVQNIRHYYNILRWQSARDARPMPPRDAEPLLPAALRDLSLRAL